jgi:hypothetical protein
MNRDVIPVGKIAKTGELARGPAVVLMGVTRSRLELYLVFRKGQHSRG